MAGAQVRAIASALEEGELDAVASDAPPRTLVWVAGRGPAGMRLLCVCAIARLCLCAYVCIVGATGVLWCVCAVGVRCLVCVWVLNCVWHVWVCRLLGC